MSELLIVDDNPSNLDLLSRILREHSHHVRAVTSGRRALESAQLSPPDLVLLDITMPEMDGFETCQRFKSNPALAAIPIIFISALDDVMDKLKAFSVGGEDYITKPFHTEEVIARVDHQLRILTLQRELKDRNQALQIMNEQKNQFLGIVAHDLRNPLSGIVLAAQMIDGEKNLERIWKDARRIHKEGMDMSTLIGRFLDVVAIESGKVLPEFESLDPVGLMKHVATRHEAAAHTKGLRLELVCPGSELAVWGDPKFFKEVVDNLISNAVKYSPQGKAITLRVEAAKNEVILSVEDQGPGLTEEDRKRLFGRFAVLSAKPTGGEKSTGLGLSIVKHMVDAMCGRIWVDSEPDKGAAFRVSLPMPSASVLAK
jgi:two-component system, sensor histidine kinase and response regulator